MKLPSIFLPDEKSSLLELLRACAHKQAALAEYADAETKKINALISRLQEYGSNCLSPLEAAEVRQNSTATVQVTQALHTMISSNLKVILDTLRMEPLYNLTSLPPGYCCRISAQGAGRVENNQDCHHGGSARLSASQITSYDEYVESGSLKYWVESIHGAEMLEAVGSGMKVGFFSPTPSYIQKASITTALITGFGIAARHTAEGIERGMAWFALTIWDCNSQKRADKFRILILSADKPCLNHDSGIISNR